MWKNLKKRLLSWSPNHLPLGILLFAWLVLVVANTDANTYFLGWDLMDSSFAPLWMIQRALFSTWQSFQGLGLLGGHGYAAQLPQAIIQLILSIFIPEMYLRYAFTYLMLLSGTIGAYFLTNRVLPPKDETTVTSKLPALAAGLVYLLHFGTVQNFYVALEPFIAMYGLLPWVLLQIFRIIHDPSIKNFTIFLALNFFLSMIGFIPPVFFSYLLFLSIIFGTFLLLQKFSKQAVLTTLVAAGIVIVSNLYWLVGVGVFTLTQNEDYLNSKLNQLTTQEFIYKNAEYGKFHNSVRLHGFLLDSFDQARFDNINGVEHIFKPWLEYLQNPGVVVFEYLLAFLLLAGLIALIYGFIKTKRIEYTIGFLGLLTLCLLTTATPPFSWVSQIFRAIPVLNQAFRIPYSKFSMSLVLFYAVGLGYLLYSLQSYWQTKAHGLKLHKSMGGIAGASIVCLVLLLCTAPNFSGNFLYKGARNHLPKPYLELFAYMAKQPADKRVAVLPVYTSTGWEMQNWGIKKGYTGSGFYWYGMRQPIMSRSFDVWSPYNENYRNELVHAVYNQDEKLFQDIIEKYDISYILVDKTVFLPNVPGEDFYIPQSESLINQTGLFEKKIDTTTIVLYELINDENSRVYVPDTVTTTAPLPERLAADPNTAMGLNTIEDPAGVQYTFAELAQEKVSAVTFSQDRLFIAGSLPKAAKNVLELPSLENKNISFNVFFLQTEASTKLILEPLLPDLHIGSEKIFKIPQLTISLSDRLPYTSTTQLYVNQTPFTFTLRANQVIPIGTLEVPFDQPLAVITSTEAFYTSSELWQPLKDLPRSLTISAGSAELNASLPIQKVYWDMQASNETSIINCGLNQNGKITKELISQGIEYTVNNRAASCDFIFIDNLPITQGYLVHLKGENVAGDPVKFVAINGTSKYPILTQKANEGEFDEWFHIIPSAKLDGSGYQFLLENQSYGSQQTKNIISEFSVYTVPSNYLVNMKTQAEAMAPLYQTFDVKTSNFGTGFIFASFDNPNTAATPLVLSEAYNDGWLAVDVSGSQKIEHTKFNNWANAWLVPPGKHTVLIFFWPQLASLFASGLLLLTAIYFYIKNKSAKKYFWNQPRKSLTDLFIKTMRAARLLFTGSHR
jgi:hypothetical protein